jgi:CRP-like cAMP-binding protein
LIEEAPRSADVIAAADLTALAIGCAAFAKLLRSEAAFTHAILHAVVGRLRNDQRAPRWELGNLPSS